MWEIQTSNVGYTAWILKGHKFDIIIIAFTSSTPHEAEQDN